MTNIKNIYNIIKIITTTTITIIIYIWILTNGCTRSIIFDRTTLPHFATNLAVYFSGLQDGLHFCYYWSLQIHQAKALLSPSESSSISSITCTRNQDESRFKLNQTRLKDALHLRMWSPRCPHTASANSVSFGRSLQPQHSRVFHASSHRCFHLSWVGWTTRYREQYSAVVEKGRTQTGGFSGVYMYKFLIAQMKLIEDDRRISKALTRFDKCPSILANFKLRATSRQPSFQPSLGL